MFHCAAGWLANLQLIMRWRKHRDARFYTIAAFNSMLLFNSQKINVECHQAALIFWRLLSLSAHSASIFNAGTNALPAAVRE